MTQVFKSLDKREPCFYLEIEGEVLMFEFTNGLFHTDDERVSDAMYKSDDYKKLYEEFDNWEKKQVVKPIKKQVKKPIIIKPKIVKKSKTKVKRKKKGK